MVLIAPLLQALSVASQFTPTDTTSNGLAARQYNPSDLPAPCQSPCQVINTMVNCGTSVSCLCASSVGSQLQQCMSCLAVQVPSVQSSAQSALDSWNQECGGHLSLNGGSGTGGSSGGTGGSSGGSGGSSSNPFGSKSGGAVGLAACSMVVCVVGALASAFVFL